MKHKKEIQLNKRTWDAVAQKYFGRTALPEWDVFAVEKDNKSLLGDIEGKTFVEIACGSGHSIDYLIQNGAVKVYALDLSHTQIEFARETNTQAIKDGKVFLFEQAMEKPIPLPEQVDVVFSIYGIGWTVDIDALLSNVNAYLQPHGKFVWSWEHPIYPTTQYQDGKFVVTQSYHDEQLIHEKSWGTDEGRHTATRKISTWYNALRKHGFDVLQILEPMPYEFEDRHQNPEKYYSSAKASLVPATVIFDCVKMAES